MEWKEFFKHSLILYGITLIFGVIWLLPARAIGTVLPSGPLLPLSLLWTPTIIILILIPLVYSFIIKKTVKEIIMIAFLFILFSSIISIPIMGILAYKNSPVTIFIREIFGTNPVSVIANPICVPYYIDNPTATCPLDYFGTFIGIVLLSLMAFMIVSISMILRNIPAIFKK